ncbi:Putative Mn2+ efflux pump MntP [Oribacterium sp. KHPX15]|uniref:manganese efflux pump MntP n=1 Tax=Oribacterium sp. KHPX15 TaxID=1855342 RepID=UPI00089A723E|nr:manganese efflux pump MntP family protein [Oribacterium sp. KHPX15]SDZ82007.1 Putative Mn2+ efflux pump MntP [Oribacterium sp. KHPX15]
MFLTPGFIINGIILGIGLAMDAFSVSMANGLKDPHMKINKMCRIAGCFAFFQWFMPMIGWICVHTVVLYFKSFQAFIPWIALILLSYIGGNMIYESILEGKMSSEEENTTEEDSILSSSTLVMQGIATSIDALSVGFTISEYHLLEAFITAVIIAVTTFIICIIGLKIGRTAGRFLKNKAGIFGGVILIGIGLEIFITNFF